MDLYKAIRTLQDELKRVELLISALERMQIRGESPDPKKKRAAPVKRRGRKTMRAAERKAVSERMKKYWEARRQQQQASALQSPLAATTGQDS